MLNLELFVALCSGFLLCCQWEYLVKSRFLVSVIGRPNLSGISLSGFYSSDFKT